MLREKVCNPAIALGLCFSVVACQTPDVSEDDAALVPEITEGIGDVLFAPPLPKSELLGALGGPCGQDFGKCGTGKKMHEKFSNLKKSAWKGSCSVSGNDVRHEVTLTVPKLVNDHGGKNDNLKVVGVYYVADGKVAGGEFTYHRNGAQVAHSQVVNTGGDQFAGSEKEVELLQGGLETLLTMSSKAAQLKFNSGLNACLSNSGLVTKTYSNGVCWQCMIAMIGGTFALGFAGGAIAAAARTGAGAGIAGGAATTAGGALTIVFGCERWCAIGRCNVEFQMCLERRALPGRGCGDQLGGCCRRNDGSCKTVKDPGKDDVCVWCDPWEGWTRG